MHFEPGFPRIRAWAGRIHGRLEAPCAEQPKAEPRAVRWLWFIFNNSISLPRGTVKAEVLSARNPESKKSQHIAKSSSNLSLCAIRERMGEGESEEKNKENKKQQRNGPAESLGQKPRCRVPSEGHRRAEMKHCVTWLCSKAGKRYLKTGTGQGGKRELRQEAALGEAGPGDKGTHHPVSSSALINCSFMPSR